MYLVVEQKGRAWGWTLYSAYHRPIAAGPAPCASREECLRSAAEARRGGVDIPVVERASRKGTVTARGRASAPTVAA